MEKGSNAPKLLEKCTILVVDDDEEMRSLLVDALQERGCEVVQFSNGNEALDFLKKKEPNLIFTDLRMPGGGFSYIGNLIKVAPNSPILLMTAYGDAHSKNKAFELGVKGYFEKPVRIEDLKGWICQFCMANPCGNYPFF